MARPLVLLALVFALLTPAAAVAQDAFSPLPPASRSTPEPTPTPEPASQATVSRPVLLGIAGAVLVVFIGIGVYISRDARRSLTEDDRLALAGQTAMAEGDRRKASAVQKKRARAAGKRQRQARKAQRRR